MQMSFDPKLLRNSYSIYEDQSRFSAESDRIAAETVSTRSATGHMVDVPHPYSKELYGDRPSKWRRVGAKREPYDQEHSFDAAGTIRFISNSQCKWIVLYGNNYIEKIGVTTERFVLDSGSRLIEHHRLSAEGGSCAIFTWANGSLQTVTHTQWDHQPKKIAGAPWGVVNINGVLRQTYYHDSEGLQQIVEEYLNADGTVDHEIRKRYLYSRLPKSVTAGTLANSIANSLCQQIPRLVENAGVAGQRYYCLLICYCNEDAEAGWPPFLLLGNEAMIDSNLVPQSERTYYLWAPDELRELPGNVEISFADETLLEACRLHSQVTNSINPIKKVLKQVVEAMQAVSWGKIISITDNFVISAVDSTSEIDSALDIKKYAPVQFRNLRRLKLI